MKWFIGYSTVSFACFGFLHADMRADIKGTSIDSYSERREAFSYALAFALVPVFWVLCPFITSLFEHGWNVTWPSRERWKEQ